MTALWLLSLGRLVEAFFCLQLCRSTILDLPSAVTWTARLTVLCLARTAATRASDNTRRVGR